MTKLKYVDFRTLNASLSGTLTTAYVFNGNNAYDPYYSSGGGSCTGYA